MLNERVLDFLTRNGLRLNTDLGQHYLISEEVVDTIMRAAGVSPDDTVLEIGPGIGVLTERLLMTAHAVTAVEIDERIIPLLENFLREGPATEHTAKLTVVHGNALSIMPPHEPYRVVANIPYHITSPLLRHLFLESPQRPTSLTLMLQREVAETICDERSAGMLTVLVRLFGSPRMVATVAPACFIPMPAVHSAIIHIACDNEPKASKDVMHRLFSVVKIAFGQKRKMLRNTLGSLPHGTEIMAKADIDPRRRPQTLSIEEWIRLASMFERL